MSEEEIEKYFKHIVINGGVPFKNLQEIFNLVEDKCNIIKFLQQENKELKEQLKMCKEFNEGLENHIKKLNDVLVKMPLEKTLMQCEIDTYKSRIDKAIEYIKGNSLQNGNGVFIDGDYNELLEILDGGK